MKQAMKQSFNGQDIYTNSQTDIVCIAKIGKESNWIFIFYVVLTVMVYIMPAIKITVPYIIAALLMLVSLPFLMWQREKIFNYTIALLFVSFYFVARFVFFSAYTLSDSINEGIRNIRFFLPVLWGVYAVRHLEKKQIRVLLLFFFIIIAYIWTNTIVALTENPEIARLLAQGAESESGAKLNFYRLANVGGFEFSYMLGIIALCFLWLFLVHRNLGLKVASGIAYCLTVYYILCSQYTTLLLLTFLGTVILLFIVKNNPFFRIVIVVLSLIFIFNVESIFYYLSGVFEGSILEVKFLNIANLLKTGNLTELGSRPELIKTGIMAWLDNPIFGSNVTGLNTHSLFIGILAQTGVVGISCWGYLMYASFRKIKVSLKQYKKGMPLLYCTIGFLALLSFLNPIGYVFEVTITVYFFVPIFIKCFGERQIEEVKRK